MSLARKIIDAMETGGIEAIRDGGDVHLLIDRKPVLIAPSNPDPKVDFTIDHKVVVLSGKNTVARIQAASKKDAREVAKIIRDSLKMIPTG